MKFTKATEVASYILEKNYKNNLAVFESELGDVSIIIQNIYNWMAVNSADKWNIKDIANKWKASYLN